MSFQPNDHPCATTGGVSPAARLLSASARLESSDLELIDRLQDQRRTYQDGEFVVREGEPFKHCCIMRSGWLGRRRGSSSGRNVTTNVYLPGDIFHVHHSFRRVSLFDVVALDRSEVAIVDPARIRALADRFDKIAVALDWSVVRGSNIISEHAVGLSTRSSSERLTHLLLEFWCRLTVVSHASHTHFRMPLSQTELGEIAGLSVVAVNRALKKLRDLGLIALHRRAVMINDVQGCISHCGFDPSFLEMFEPRGLARLSDYTR